MIQISYLTADNFKLHDWINSKENQIKYEYRVEKFSKYYGIYFDNKKSYKDYHEACLRINKAIEKYIQETFSYIFVFEEDNFYNALNSWLEKDDDIAINETNERVIYLELLKKVLENKSYIKEHYTDKDIDICI